MTYTLTEEERQKIQVGFDSLLPYPEGKERNLDWDSWAGIERQLNNPEKITKDGKKVKMIFHMSRSSPSTEEEEQNSLFQYNFTIHRMILENQ